MAPIMEEESIWTPETELQKGRSFGRGIGRPLVVVGVSALAVLGETVVMECRCNRCGVEDRAPEEVRCIVVTCGHPWNSQRWRFRPENQNNPNGGYHPTGRVAADGRPIWERNRPARCSRCWEEFTELVMVED